MIFIWLLILELAANNVWHTRIVEIGGVSTCAVVYLLWIQFKQQQYTEKLTVLHWVKRRRFINYSHWIVDNANEAGEKANLRLLPCDTIVDERYQHMICTTNSHNWCFWRPILSCNFSNTIMIRLRVFFV